MTTTKRRTFFIVPTVVLILFALLFAGLPAYAAENTDTSGETQASVSFKAGIIKLESVPVLNFGDHAISHEEQTYEAVSVTPDIQVSDLRGSGKGWDLFVALSAFELEDSGEPTLKAASIRITSPTVSAVNGNLGTPPSAQADVTLTSDSTQTPILTAANGEGMGVWQLHWDAAHTTLTVKPGTAQEGTSVATLTWSLQSTP